METFATLADSPAYRSPQYLAVAAEWDYLWDIFQGISAWSVFHGDLLTPTEKAYAYLTKHPEESGEEYAHRFALSDFPASFSASLSEYVDLMFSNGIQINAPDWFLEHWQSLSDTDSSGDVLLPEIALNAMVFGVYHVFIDCVEGRPRWVPISPRDVINWRYEGIGGVQRLIHVTIENDLGSGERLITRYERGGRWERYRYFKDDNGKYVFILEETGVIEAMSKPLVEIPLVPVHLSNYRPSLMVGDRKFRTLADKTRTLYQLLSDYRRKMQLCNTPQPVLYDPTVEENIVISPNRVIRLHSPDAFFRWVETNTSSLVISRQEIIDLQESISYDSAKFLKSPESRVSAGAADLTTVPLQASLFGFSKIFLEAIANITSFHQAYMGDDSLIQYELVPSVRKQSPKDSQFAFSAQSLYDKGILSRHSTVKMLNEADYISDEITKEELSNPEVYDRQQ